MQFTVDADAVNNALDAVAGVTGRASLMPVYTHTLIEADEDGSIAFRATDGDAVLYHTIEGDVGEEGAALLPVKELRDLAKRARSANIVLATKGPAKRKVIMRSGRFEAEINGLRTMDFPDIKQDGDKVATYPVEVFKEALNRVKWAVFSEGGSHRMNMRGFYLRTQDGALVLEATTGHVMARAEIKDGNPSVGDGIIVPPNAVAKAMVAASREGVEEVALYQHENYFIARSGATEAKTRLISADPPKVDNIWNQLKQYNKVAEIGVDELLASADRVGVLAPDNKGIVLAFSETGSGVEVRTMRNGDTGTAEDTVECQYDGDEAFEVGVNFSYLKQALKVIPTERVRIDMRKNSQPLTFTAVGDDPFSTRSLVMPLRIPG